MKKYTVLILFLLLNTSIASAEIKIGFVEVQKILKFLKITLYQYLDH